jgi:hypothetical protein
MKYFSFDIKQQNHLAAKSISVLFYHAIHWVVTSLPIFHVLFSQFKWGSYEVAEVEQ